MCSCVVHVCGVVDICTRNASVCCYGAYTWGLGALLVGNQPRQSWGELGEGEKGREREREGGRERETERDREKDREREMGKERDEIIQTIIWHLTKQPHHVYTHTHTHTQTGRINKK